MNQDPALPESALAKYAAVLHTDADPASVLDMRRPHNVLEADLQTTSEVIAQVVYESSAPSDAERQLSQHASADGHANLSSIDRMRKLVAGVLTSNEFEWAIGLLIVLNAVTIGMEQTWRVEGRHVPVMAIIENVFLGIFFLELGARGFAFGIRQCMKNSWVIFDFILVSVSVLVWLLNPFLGSLDGLGFFLVLRTVRLLRLGRTLRLLIHFKELWMLVRGLLGSAYTILYTLLILLVIIYMFASVGIEVITENPLADPVDGDPEFSSIVDEHFNSLAVFMLTLLQFATLDSVAAIYTPLIKRAPLLACYFSALVVVLGIVLMNLITAVVVNSALETAMQDKEMVALDERKRKQKMIQDLSNIFQRLDVDASGEISREELSGVVGEDREMLQKILTITDPLDIFDALDVDENGQVGIEEFCEQLWMAYCFRGSVDIKRTEKKVDSIRLMLEAMDPNRMVKRCRTKKPTRKWTRQMTHDTELDSCRKGAQESRETRVEEGNQACPSSKADCKPPPAATPDAGRQVPASDHRVEQEMPQWARHVVGEMQATRQVLLEELERMRVLMVNRLEDRRCTLHFATPAPTRPPAGPTRQPPPPSGATSEAGAAAAAAKSADLATIPDGCQACWDMAQPPVLSGGEVAMKRAVVAQVMAECDRMASPPVSNGDRSSQAGSTESDMWAVDSRLGHAESYMQPTSTLPRIPLSEARWTHEKGRSIPAKVTEQPSLNQEAHLPSPGVLDKRQ